MSASALDKIDVAKRRMKRSARAIQAIGCEKQCHPERTRWLRRQTEHHHEQCEARTRIVAALNTYADLLTDSLLGKQAQVAIDAELERYAAAMRKVGM